MPADSQQIAFWLGGSRSEKPDAYRDASPASYIKAGDPPMFFFHGKQDLLVPVESPTHMVELLKNAGGTAEIYTISDAGHIQALFDQNALERGLAFADRYLKSKDAGVNGAGDGPARSISRSHELIGAHSGSSDGN